MANEKTFVDALKRSAKKIDPNAFVWKTNDRASVGIPDLYMVINGTSVHLEVKASYPVSRERDGDRGLLRHCFTGPQIGTMRLMQKADAIVGGIVRTSPSVSYIIDPFDIPISGQVTYDLLETKAFRCTHDGKLWRIDEWVMKRIEDLSLGTAKKR